MIQPSLRKFIRIDAELSAPVELGAGRGGLRKIIPIIGGKVSGEIEGRVLNIGADWQTVHTPELAHLDARYAIETDDGAVIEIHNQGFRYAPNGVAERLLAGKDVDPSEYYFRTVAMLETGDARYQWVNTHVFVGTGRRNKDSVSIEFYVVE